MKTTITLKTAVLTAATLAWSLSAQAGDITRCDKVFEEVRAAVEAEPQKILVIIEDAMVANETCACEIVKAAILASKADRELTRQIVLTATHVAPKMGPLIAECAGAISPDGGKGVVESVKQVIGVQPEEPVSDYSVTPSDIRGVYLIQPSTTGGGYSSSSPRPEKPPTTGGHVLSNHSVPQSPSVAQGP